MAPAKPIFTLETFKFLKDLGRHNHKEWMEANRDRYQAVLIQPFRRLLEELAPAVLELDSRFDTSGRTFPLGRKANGAPRPPLRELLVQDNKGGVDKTHRLAGFH